MLGFRDARRLLAVLAHKGFETLIVSLAFVKANVSLRRCWIFLVLYALTTPLGYGVVALLKEAVPSEGADWGMFVEGMVENAAAGSFIYLCSVWIQTKAVFGMKGQVLGFLLGFAFIAALSLFGGHSHERGHEDGH